MIFLLMLLLRRLKRTFVEGISVKSTRLSMVVLDAVCGVKGVDEPLH